MAHAEKFTVKREIIVEEDAVRLVLTKMEAETLRTLLYTAVTGHSTQSRRKHLGDIGRELERVGVEVKRDVSSGYVDFKDEEGFDDEG